MCFFVYLLHSRKLKNIFQNKNLNKNMLISSKLLTTFLKFEKNKSIKYIYGYYFKEEEERNQPLTP